MQYLGSRMLLALSPGSTWLSRLSKVMTANIESHGEGSKTLMALDEILEQNEAAYLILPVAHVEAATRSRATLFRCFDWASISDPSSSERLSNRVPHL